jgi:thioredoxin reductase (NADPH)
MSLTETPDRYGAFPRLSDQQIQALARRGERRPTQPGQVLCREGDRGCDFFVVLEGRVAVVEGFGGDERVVRVHGPGRFLGELGLLTGQAALLTSVVREGGEVLAVPVERLRELVAEDAALGDLVLRAYLIRRSILISLGAGIRIVGSRYSPDTRRLREFAARNRLPHRWIDLEEDREAEALLRELGVAPRETPVVI